jgi:hypothetical protein
LWYFQGLDNFVSNHYSEYTTPTGCKVQSVSGLDEVTCFCCTKYILTYCRFYYCEYSYYEEESIAGGFAALMETLKDVQDVQTSFEPPGTIAIHSLS